MSEPKQNPIIEDAFNKKLAGESLKNGLDFISNMREHKFTFKGKGAKWTIDCTNWKIHYKGKNFATIIINDDNTFGICTDFDNKFQLDDNLKEGVLAMVIACPQWCCKEPYCKSSRINWEILGKTHERVCHSPIQVFNPDSKAIETVIKIMLLYKQERISESRA